MESSIASTYNLFLITYNFFLRRKFSGSLPIGLPTGVTCSFSYQHHIYMGGALAGNWEKLSAEHRKQYKHLLERGDKKKILKQLPHLHVEAFDKIDCLSCARCCKGYSPRFKTPDIKRIAKTLRMKEGDFIETYLRLDEDGDYVTQRQPCPFLAADNTCNIYDDRPSDCARFPYTDEDVLFKRPQITLKNSEFCPIVHFVLERLI